MRIDIKTKEVILDDKDKDIVGKVEEKISSISQDNKDMISMIIDNNLKYMNIYHPEPQSLTTISSAIENILDQPTTSFLVENIINPQYIKYALDKLKSENIITENTSKFMLELSIRYGYALHTLAANIEKPYDWSRIESYPIISNNVLKLESMIWRIDGNILEFDSSIDDILTLISHFLRKTLDAINLTDKEWLLKLDKNKIDELLKKANELKELYLSIQSVKSEFENK